MLLLSISGVAIGVAVVAGIDLTNHSASRAFRLSADAVTGTATHQIVSSSGELPDSVYVALATARTGVRIAPLIEGYARLPSCDQRIVRIIGIDPLADGEVRGLVRRADLDLGRFLSSRMALVDRNLVDQCGLEADQAVRMRIDGIEKEVTVGGFVEASEGGGNMGLTGVLVVDISTGQELLGMAGSLSRIDIRVAEGDAGQEDIAALTSRLRGGLVIQQSDSRTQVVGDMTRAFEVNLSALSLLALMVGMFLIYNTITFSVVQRRILIGRLRAIGVSRRQVFLMVLLESLLVGLPASIVGLALGVLLSKGLIGLATQTINDLYFVLTVSTVDLSAAVLLKASAIGVLATSLSAVPPAMEATSVDVATVLRSSSLESRARLNARRLAVFAIGPLVVAIALIALSGKSVWTGYAGLFFVIVMFVLLTPVAVTVGCLVLRWIFGSALGTLGRMAARAVVASLSRTGVAIAALAVAVAATLAVGIMVDSFRGTVEQWLSYTLQADVYVQPPRVIARRGDSRIEAALAEELRGLPGVRDSYSVAHESIQTDVGTVDVVVIEPGPMTPRTFRLRSGSEDLWTRLEDEDILLLSEPFSYRHDRGLGDHIELTTPEGTRRFRIAGVYVDYASDVGTVLMARSTFTRHLGDPGIAGLALYASEGVAENDLIRQIESRSAGRQELVAQSNAALRGISLDIFDRTFAITSVLRLLAILVAFIGVLSALMALQLERSREIAVLRANGMSVGQVWGYVSLQTGGMGLLAGILSVPLGTILALLLIHVINRRSFGWTLEVSLDPADMVYTILLATGAAILAGLYPSWVMSRINPSSALRYE